jgi:hypothetical protein
LRNAVKKLLTRLRKGGNRSPARRPVKDAQTETKARSGGGAAQSTGETVFGDMPLRLRNLTLVPAGGLSGIDPASLAGGFKIRLAKLQDRRRDAVTLVERRYGSVGYSIPHPKQEDPKLFTFIAYDEGALVGTVGVRLDSELGLSAEELYKTEIDLLRQAGSRVCEFTQLAADKSAARKPVLAGLFHTAYLFASVIRGCTHAVIEVTPQHAGFYHRALRFEQIGEERLNPRVHTLGVLMRVAFEDIEAGLAKYAGKPDVPGAQRSLFIYGFPPHEEAGVLRRLRELGDWS